MSKTASMNSRLCHKGARRTVACMACPENLDDAHLISKHANGDGGAIPGHKLKAQLAAAFHKCHLIGRWPLNRPRYLTIHKIMVSVDSRVVCPSRHAMASDTLWSDFSTEGVRSLIVG